MRLVSFSRSGTAERSLGALEGDRILELGAAASIVAPGLDSAGRLRSLDLLLGDWERGLPLARSVFERALSAGSKHPNLASAWHARARVTLHAPISRPPTIRDFYAFEAHVKNARGRRAGFEAFVDRSARLRAGDCVRDRDPGAQCPDRSVALDRGGLHDPERLERARPAAK